MRRVILFALALALCVPAGALAAWTMPEGVSLAGANGGAYSASHTPQEDGAYLFCGGYTQEGWQEGDILWRSAYAACYEADGSERWRINFEASEGTTEATAFAYGTVGDGRTLLCVSEVGEESRRTYALLDVRTGELEPYEPPQEVFDESVFSRTFGFATGFAQVREKEARLLWLDKDFDILWEREVGLSQMNRFAEPTVDGDAVLLMGHTDEHRETTITSLDRETGETRYDRVADTQGRPGVGQYVTALPGGGLAFSFSDANDIGEAQASVARLDEAGDTVWIATLEDFGAFEARDVAPLGEGVVVNCRREEDYYSALLLYIDGEGVVQGSLFIGMDKTPEATFHARLSSIGDRAFVDGFIGEDSGDASGVRLFFMELTPEAFEPVR